MAEAKSIMSSSSLDSLPGLPPDTEPLEHQVAGHFYGRSKTKFGLLQRCSTGDVLKPLLNPPRGPREHQFYLHVFSDEVSEDLRALRTFLPAYLGTYEYDGMTYLILENILRPFTHPCIADIKLGRITYDCEATEEKIERQIRKFPSAIEIGFQLLGWKTYRAMDNLYDYHDKICGRSLTKQELVYAIGNFYGAPESDYRSIVRLVLERLVALEHLMKEQYGLIFIASSLLIVYEGGGRNENEQTNHPPPRVDVRLVDFAHVFPSQKIPNENQSDENFLFGLSNYMDHLRMLLDETFVYVSVEKLNHNTYRNQKSTCDKTFSH